MCATFFVFEARHVTIKIRLVTNHTYSFKLLFTESCSASTCTKQLNFVKNKKLQGCQLIFCVLYYLPTR